ncbi:MAG: phasin family protein [Atopobiaceae bacterium]|jgi:polyhydroxyalkanoate synthesis regulator phasin|nr:phasin family protein [Atopobiaceae bacterium]MCH4119137.1 phasin family protein [Atopobiaceae bacterium]MCI1318100.1 phasin family protein [Atopobiaceae bacterium]MCI1388604.1 phasin family protein [Atopobiaceae bacterium]MCI1432103.1 phasin family protein [Atopobiaceae bacterium]
MADLNLTDGLKTIFLAGIGAVATGAEKGQEVVDKLVEKGELTVAQGKALNEELKRKAKDVGSQTTDAALKSRLASMSPEEREAFAKHVADMVSDIDAETVEPDEVEDAGDEPEA